MWPIFGHFTLQGPPSASRVLTTAFTGCHGRFHGKVVESKLFRLPVGLFATFYCPPPSILFMACTLSALPRGSRAPSPPPPPSPTDGDTEPLPSRESSPTRIHPQLTQSSWSPHKWVIPHAQDLSKDLEKGQLKKMLATFSQQFRTSHNDSISLPRMRRNSNSMQRYSSSIITHFNKLRKPR